MLEPAPWVSSDPVSTSQVCNRSYWKYAVWNSSKGCILVCFQVAPKSAKNGFRHYNLLVIDSIAQACSELKPAHANWNRQTAWSPESSISTSFHLELLIRIELIVVHPDSGQLCWQAAPCLHLDADLSISISVLLWVLWISIDIAPSYWFSAQSRWRYCSWLWKIFWWTGRSNRIKSSYSWTSWAFSLRTCCAYFCLLIGCSCLGSAAAALETVYLSRRKAKAQKCLPVRSWKYRPDACI